MRRHRQHHPLLPHQLWMSWWKEWRWRRRRRLLLRRWRAIMVAPLISSLSIAIIERLFVTIYQLFGNWKKTKRIEYQRKFGNDHVELVKDPRFGQFVFAFSTTMYLNTYLNSNLKSSYSFNAVQQLLQLGISIKFACTSSIRLSVVEGCDKDIGFKHIRDINDERGVINCLSRETKNFCDCMKPKKIEAKNMEKLGQCHGCKEWFQKADLLFCTGCNAVKYCSKECQRQKWNDHKVDCKRIRET